jgi:hypothetical protein
MSLCTKYKAIYLGAKSVFNCRKANPQKNLPNFQVKTFTGLPLIYFLSKRIQEFPNMEKHAVYELFIAACICGSSPSHYTETGAVTCLAEDGVVDG